ncbi:MAG: flagellar basal body L-ring protein FlgH [Mesorhizobium sp.]
MKAAIVTVSLALALTGCGMSRELREVNKVPALSPVGSGLVGTSQAGYPTKPSPPLERTSLWNDRQSHLFTDARALSVGDVMTVMISINDRAKFSNESERLRTATRDFSIGGQYAVKGVGGDADAGFDIGSGTRHKGTGQTERSENLRLSVAAIVTEVLPNGNLIITGTQEVQVNAELRVLTISGIVRPQDIGADNTISYERIAEARVSYGGRGRLTEVQQPPYGQQILDKILPF